MFRIVMADQMVTVVVNEAFSTVEGLESDPLIRSSLLFSDKSLEEVVHCSHTGWYELCT